MQMFRFHVIISIRQYWRNRHDKNIHFGMWGRGNSSATAGMGGGLEQMLKAIQS